ncbi:acetoin utilization protein AcuC [Populibacterium corticicola]|uniref:Acetoin utilization protein AcuC n=1 Tax=Populibacterium corticicola TaxID=1812826 RepID=A0ABW5XGE7_9MICO
MPFQASLSWSKDLLNYNFGFGHPMSPVRLDLTMRLAQDLGLLERDDLQILTSSVANDDILALVHSPEYIAAVRRAADHDEPNENRGLGTEDNPSFPGMHDAAARMVQCSIDTALAVWRGEAEHGLNLAGGMHHAMPDGAAGFCVYNDAAVAIRVLQREGAHRVMYIDLDAHHGDGVERAFWDDPNVLTFSIHQSGTSLFPGTGFVTEIGGPGAEGTAVNLPLPARTDSSGWLRALHAVLPDIVDAFRPDFIVSQHGCDAHFSDTMSDLRVSIDAQRQAAQLVHELAHQYAGGRWLALGGGGYSVVDVVPVAWTHVIGVVTHNELGCEITAPETWREYIHEYLDHTPPETLGDCHGSATFKPWHSGYNPENEVDRAIRATRSAIYPRLGLDMTYEI